MEDELTAAGCGIDRLSYPKYLPPKFLMVESTIVRIVDYAKVRIPYFSDGGN